MDKIFWLKKYGTLYVLYEERLSGNGPTVTSGPCSFFDHRTPGLINII